jgi:capsular exopolysaccharide synthesis family protein
VDRPAASRLRDYARTLLARKWLVVMAVVVALVVAVAVNLASTKVYSATSKVLAATSQAVDRSGRPVVDPTEVPTQVELIKAQPLALEVARRLGAQAPLVSAVRVRAVGHSRVIAVIIESPNATVAANGATTFAQAYVDNRRAASANTNASILQPATVPKHPARPQPLRNLFIALAGGLLVGLIAAFVFEYFDDAIRSVEDVEHESRGKPIIGTIPEVAIWRNREKARLVTVEEPSSDAADAYRALRASLQFATSRSALPTILFTGPSGDEGTTTTLANVAVTLARAGRRVMCVDCNLREPRLHEFFGVDATVGFTSVLLGDKPLSASAQTIPVGGSGSLRFLPSGPLPPNPDELLTTTRLLELFRAITADADVVLIDAPALLDLPDAAALARRVDGVVLTVAAGVTSKRDLRVSVDDLDDAGATTLGVVVNMASLPAKPAATSSTPSSERGERVSRRRAGARR